MKLDISNKDVLIPKQQPFDLERKDIDFLKTMALSNYSGKSRICSHKNIEDKLHEMFIAHQKDYYVRPHRHFRKSESILLLKGKADFVSFNDVGEIKNVIKLENFASGKSFYHRMDLPIYHMIIIRSKLVVFYEVTNGPLNRKDTEFAPWSPPIETLESKKFLKKIKKQIKKFLST